MGQGPGPEGVHHDLFAKGMCNLVDKIFGLPERDWKHWYVFLQTICSGIYQPNSDSAGTEGFSDNVGCCFPALPDLYVFTTDAKVPTNMVLKCMATGFSSTNTILQIKLNGQVLTREQGVQSSDILPNGDGTFQITHSMEIPKSDNSNYFCELTHPASGLRAVKFWGKNLCLLFNVHTFHYCVLRAV